MTTLIKSFQTTTFRLSLTYLVLFSAAAALAIGYIYWNTTVLLSRQLEQTIQAEIQGLAEHYRQGGLNRLATTVAERSQVPGNSLYLVTDARARHIAGNLKSVSRKLWNTVGRVEFVYRRPAEGGPEKRLAFASVFRLPGGFRLIVGRDIEDRREFGRVISSAVLWGLGVMALFGIGGGYLVSRNLLSRIEAVTATSRTIMTGDLTGRVPVTGAGDELDRLSRSLNEMLDRIEQLMNGLREVSDNIAHDLKTPLNRLRNRVEGALRDPNGEGGYREALEKTIEEADELIRTFNSLLSIARLEAGAAGGTLEDVDLALVVRDVTDLYEPLAEEQGMKLRAEVPDGLVLVGDRQLLGQALANLIDNAIKYGAPDSQNTVPATGVSGDIAVKVRRAGATAEISVADHGLGIPEHERDRVLKRFVRLEASRSRPGSGLGLSLAAAVARLHNGKIRLEDNEPGLKVVLDLPLKRNGSAVEAENRAAK